MARAANPVPTMPGQPLVGSLLDLRRDPLSTYQRARSERGDVVRLVAGPPGMLFVLYGVFSAEGAHQVLVRDATNFSRANRITRELRESIGNGLLTSEDDVYRRHRRLLQPLFSRRHVDGYATTMCDEARLMTERWRDREDPVVDLRDEAVSLSLRVLTRVLFSTDAAEALGMLRRCLPVIVEHTMRRGLSPVNVPRHWPTPANRRHAAAQRELYALCDRIIDSHDADGGGDDLLTLLVGAGDDDGSRLSPTEIRDQVLIFLLAGHETTASSVAFALHLLALHPQAQARARDEVDQVLGGRAAGAQDLGDLPYTTQVLKEALRLFPPAPTIGRRTVADCEIAGHPVPADANVVVSPWVTHRHPSYWPDPDRFDPDRFTAAAETERPRYAWFPFGGGHRACIGQHFAMLESVLCLATTLQAFELTPVDTTVPLTQRIVLSATGPVRCRLTPR